MLVGSRTLLITNHYLGFFIYYNLYFGNSFFIIFGATKPMNHTLKISRTPVLITQTGPDRAEGLEPTAPFAAPGGFGSPG